MDPALFFGGDKDMLPTGSSGEQRQPFNLRDRRDRRDDDDEGPPPSRADEDGGWRRGPRTQPNQPQQRLTQGNPDEEAGWRRGSRQDDRGPPMREDDRGNERRDDRQDDRRDFGGRREGGGGGLRSFDRDGGNDRADALGQWERGDGPFARLREGGGEGDSRYGAADAAAGGATDVALTDEERVVARDALLAAADATARTGWRAAADAAYMGFTVDSLTHSIFLESKESVCSNGVLLQRQ